MPSDNNNPPPEHPPKKQKLTDNAITPPPEPPSTTTAATTATTTTTETTTTITSSDLRKLIQHFTHSQLTELLITASLNHPEVLADVRALADSDITQRKLHVRGLDLKTTSASLRSVFAPYGELEEAMVLKNKATFKSSRYGLVIYKHVDSALLALKEPFKIIDGRMSFSVLAKDSTSVFVDNANGRKVYVENVTSGVSAEKLLECFQEYGEVEEGPVGFDKTTGEFKGFAFIIYKNVDGAKACLVDPVKCVDGCELRCRLANDFGILGYGGGGQGPPLGHSQHPSHLSSGPGMSLSAQVQGSGGGVRPEGVNSNQQSSMQGSFASQFGNGGPSVGSSCGGNSGGLGLQGVPGGSFGYGILGKGPPLGHSQHPLNLSSGGGSVMSSFGSSVGGMGLSTSGGLQPSSLRVDGGWFSGDSHLGGPGASYGGTENGGGTGLSTHGSQAPSCLGGDNGVRYGGSHFGSPGLRYGGTGSGGGVELGTRAGGAGPSYGGLGSGVAGLGNGFVGSDARFVRQSSGGEVGLSDSLGGPSTSYGVSGSGRGVGLGGGFGGLGSSYGVIETFQVELMRRVVKELNALSGVTLDQRIKAMDVIGHSPTRAEMFFMLDKEGKSRMVQMVWSGSIS